MQGIKQPPLQMVLLHPSAGHFRFGATYGWHGNRAFSSRDISWRLHQRLDRLRPAVLEVAQRYGASNLRVFGSVALNQEHQDSDLDLLVDLPANQSLLALVGITQELEQLLGCPVDVAEPDSLHPLIRAEVLQHAVGL